MRSRRLPVRSFLRAASGAVALSLGMSAVAFAQSDAPVPPASAPMASHATPSYATPAGDEQITGRITAITGKYSLQVRDNRGFIDNVSLHQGTIINPTGLTLSPGMQVAITGSNSGATFAANQIDAPYAVALAPAVGYGIGFGYGGWGWGPRFRTGFWW